MGHSNFCDLNIWMHKHLKKRHRKKKKRFNIRTWRTSRRENSKREPFLKSIKFWRRSTGKAPCFSGKELQNPEADFVSLGRGQAEDFCRRIVWLCLTILWNWCLKDITFFSKQCQVFIFDKTFSFRFLKFLFNMSMEWLSPTNLMIHETFISLRSRWFTA